MKIIDPPFGVLFHRNAASAMAALLLAGLYGFVYPAACHAESLFRVSTTYNAQEPLRPRSLFTPPISREVGDLVTILIDETTSQDTSAELKITRTHTVDENGSSMYNQALGFFLGKLPLNAKKVGNILKAPSFDGMDNANTLNSKAESSREVKIKDSVACQVVQVLPNGDLVVQGHKSVQYSKERSELIITGIVKPYYLDRYNQIASKMVANLQMMQGGKGVISRQQNDGLANKIYQFFN